MTTTIKIQSVNPLADPTIIALTGMQSVPSDARYIVRVSSNDPSWILTAPSGQSHRIQNAGSNEFRVAYTTGSIGVPVGSEVEVIWSSATSNHLVQLTTSSAFDTVIDDTSENAPQTKIIKAYVDSEVAGVPGASDDAVRAAAWPMAILIVRAGAIVYDGTDANATTAGANFKTALGLLQEHDTMICGPGSFNCIDATLAVDNVKLLCFGTTLRINDNYDRIMYVTGSNCEIRGLYVDGGEDANTGNGRGFVINGDDVKMYDCGAMGCKGYAVTFGEGLYVQGQRFYSDGFYCERPYYSGVTMVGADNWIVKNTTVINTRNRVFQTRGDGNFDYQEIDGLYSYTGIDLGGQTLIPAVSFNHRELDPGGNPVERVAQVIIRNVHMWIKSDLFNDALTRQIFKVQNIKNLLMQNVFIKHGSNAGGGAMWSFRHESSGAGAACERIVFDNVWMSGSMTLTGAIPDLFEMRNCQLSQDFIGGNISITRLAAKRAVIANNHFNLHAGVRAMSIETTWSDEWNIEIYGNTFEGDKDSPGFLYVADGGEIQNGAGNVKCYDNQLINNGSGAFFVTNDADGSLVMTTNANGEILFDADIIGTGYNKHPDPGAGPNYFASVPAGPEGTVIRNIRKLSSGSAYPTAWMSDGTNWKSWLA